MVPGVSGRLISLETLDRAIAAEREPFARSGRADWRTAHATLGPASGLRAMVEQGLEPMLALLGFEPLADREFSKDCAVMSARAGGQPIIALVSRWGHRLDTLRSAAIAAAAQRRASFALLFNGTHLRLVQAERFHSRRFVELDLDLAADDDRAAAALGVLFGAENLANGPGNEPSRLAALIAQTDQQGILVSRSLKDGVLAASGHVLNALIARSRGGGVEAAFDQALTIVYRLLFLFFAEARMLVPLWHPVYRESYSLETLRNGALARPVQGLWDTIRAISRLAHAGCRAGNLRVTPFNGRLFAPSHVPLAERRDLDEEAARHALLVLSTRPAEDGDGRVPLVYRNLGVEQLGAVSETLLDYRPRLESPAGPSSKKRTTARLERGATLRKASGTYYTPQAIADYLVRRALEPLTRERSGDDILRLRVLDPSMGSGAFLVSACRFLAAAYEDALIAAGASPADIGAQERAAFRRLVAERCLYGVDSNPMAVQLARLSLWLATLAADRPLSFLDHHLRCGDSVVGTWLSLLGRAPQAARKSRHAVLPLFDATGVEAAIHTALPVRFALELEPNDTPAQVRAKERALATLADPDSPLARWKRIADLWCARWFTSTPPPRSAFADLCDAILGAPGALPASSAGAFLRASDDAARRRQFFHWELEFPEVFFTPDGTRRPDAGFDAVIGNPPWDMVRADKDDDAGAARDCAALVRFTRDSGVYLAQSDGHANRYQMFVERALALARSGGSLALVLPAGLASDHGSAPLRRHLFERSAVESIVGFDNRRAVFPIHRGLKFLLLTTRLGTPTTTLRCRFGETDVSALEAVEDRDPEPFLPIVIGRELLRDLSSDEAIPDVRSPRDLAIAERAAALFAPLGSSASWSARFGRELNGSDDRRYFRTAGRGRPVIGGRQIEPFRARPEQAVCRILTRDATRLLGDRYLRPRLAYRDVSSPTNKTTLIAAVLPSGIVSTHTLFCLRSPLSLASQYFLCGLFNSFVVNFLVRLRVSSHVTTAIVEGLPIPARAQAGPWFHEIAGAARRLSRTRDPRLIARLNAGVARLYGATTAEYAHVLESFPLVPASERQSAIRVFEEMG